MREQAYIPEVVDFAYQIIDMHHAIESLRGDLEHEKEMNKILRGGQESSEKHGKEMLGIMLNGILDPNSRLNRGDRAVAELKIKAEGWEVQE